VPPRTTFRNGCPGATRTRDPRLRTAVLCSTELRDNKDQSHRAEAVVRPGGVEPPTALQSGAHDGYKPSALPVELWAPRFLRMSLSENRFPLFRDMRVCACPYRKTGSHFSGTCVHWSGWLDSNQRPPASEAGTLAGLSYTLLTSNFRSRWRSIRIAGTPDTP
jgi:hypothetical protein